MHYLSCNFEKIYLLGNILIHLFHSHIRLQLFIPLVLLFLSVCVLNIINNFLINVFTHFKFKYIPSIVYSFNSFIFIFILNIINNFKRSVSVIVQIKNSLLFIVKYYLQFTIFGNSIYTGFFFRSCKVKILQSDSNRCILLEIKNT